MERIEMHTEPLLFYRIRGTVTLLSLAAFCYPAGIGLASSSGWELLIAAVLCALGVVGIAAVATLRVTMTGDKDGRPTYYQ